MAHLSTQCFIVDHLTEEPALFPYEKACEIQKRLSATVPNDFMVGIMSLTGEKGWRVYVSSTTLQCAYLHNPQAFYFEE